MKIPDIREIDNRYPEFNPAAEFLRGHQSYDAAKALLAGHSLRLLASLRSSRSVMYVKGLLLTLCLGVAVAALPQTAPLPDPKLTGSVVALASRSAEVRVDISDADPEQVPILYYLAAAGALTTAQSGRLASLSTLLRFSGLTPDTDYIVTYQREGTLLGQTEFHTPGEGTPVPAPEPVPQPEPAPTPTPPPAPVVYTAPKIKSFTASLSAGGILTGFGTISANSGRLITSSATIRLEGTDVDLGAVQTGVGGTYKVSFTDEFSLTKGASYVVTLKVSYRLNGKFGTLTKSVTVTMPYQDLTIDSLAAAVNENANSITVSGTGSYHDAAGVTLAVNCPGLLFAPATVTDNGDGTFAFSAGLAAEAMRPGTYSYSVTASYTLGTSAATKQSASQQLTIRGFEYTSMTAAYDKATGLVTLKATAVWHGAAQTVTGFSFHQGDGTDQAVALAKTSYADGEQLAAELTVMPYAYSASASYFPQISYSLDGTAKTDAGAQALADTQMSAPDVVGQGTAPETTGTIDAARCIYLTIAWNDASGDSLADFALTYDNGGTPTALTGILVTEKDAANRQTKVSLYSNDFLTVRDYAGVKASFSYQYPGNPAVLNGATSAKDITTPGYRILGLARDTAAADRIYKVTAELEGGTVTSYSFIVSIDGTDTTYSKGNAAITESGTGLTLTLAGVTAAEGTTATVSLYTEMADGTEQRSAYTGPLN